VTALAELHGIGLGMGTRYAPTSFTDPETKEDHVAQLHVGYTTDPEKAQRARDMGATVTTCASLDPRFTGYEITLRVIDP
jgi:hypothetical protein